ncbi:MAG: hypothetical protein IPP13_25050 [Kouleothrix sp.]|jgi:hypothetical protein|nr:hypothetical protein [Kouleothrix sp.]
MSENLLFHTSKSGVDFTLEAFELLRVYPNYCISDWESKIEMYRTESATLAGSQEPNTKTDSLIRQAQDEIRRAQVVVRDLSELHQGRRRMFTVNFKRKAEVNRRVRIELGLAKIEDSPHLYAALKIEMEMLKAENPYFSFKRFVDYINSEGEAAL